MASVIERYQQQIQPNAQLLPATAQGVKVQPTLGPEVQQEANDIGDFAVKRDEANQKLWLASRQATDETTAQQMLDDAMRSAPEGASIKDVLNNSWGKHVTQQSQAIDNPVLQDKYTAQLTTIGASLADKAEKFDTAQKDRYTETSTTDTYNNMAKYYSTLTDPTEIQSKLQDDVGKLSSILNSTPMDAEKRDKLKKDAVKNLTDSANTKWIELDPVGYKVAHAVGMTDAQRQSDTTLPRGIRNNNPGNIRKSADNWQGAAGDDGEYVKFDTPEQGLRAMGKNLVNQQKIHGLNTVEDIVTKYAPPTENNTPAYIQSVSTALGVNPQDKINLSDPETLQKFMNATITQENGAQPYSAKSVAWAAKAALSPDTAGPAPSLPHPEDTAPGAKIPVTNTGSSAWNLGTYEQQKNWGELADKQIKENTAKAEKDKAVVNARTGSDMKIAAERGGLTYAQVEDAYSKSTISPETRTELTKTLDEQNHMDAKSHAAMQRVGQAIQGVAVLDPKNTDDKKAVDEHFKETMAQVQATAKPEDVQTHALALVKQYGMVPESLQGQIRGEIRSGNVEDVVHGADLIAKLRATNPQLLNDFAEEDIKAANHVGSLIDAGFTPQIAVARAMESLKVTPEIKAARSEDFKVKSKDSTPQDYIQRQTSSYWRSNPDVPPEMASQFNQLAESEYQRTGNFAAAQKTAGDFITRTWGQTSIGLGPNDETGRHWMKNSPEMYYAAPVAGVDNSEWMKEQLGHDVSKLDTLGGRTFDPDNMMLIPSPTKTQDGRPTYFVFYKDDNGVLNQFSGENKPLVWHPDWQTSDERERTLRRARDREANKNKGPVTMNAGGV